MFISVPCNGIQIKDSNPMSGIPPFVHEDKKNCRDSFFIFLFFIDGFMLRTELTVRIFCFGFSFNKI